MTLVFLAVVYWGVGKSQYRLNVMDVEEFEPVSTLKVPEHKLTHAKFPFIDVHNHQWIMPVQSLDKLVVEMDSLNMGVMGINTYKDICVVLFVLTDRILRIAAAFPAGT